MSLEYCIWGCGNRGKNICRFMGGKRVRAFIDSDPALEGSACCGIPVIGFEGFLRDFSQCVVIVSPLLQQRDIQQKLEQQGVRCLSPLFLPPEITEVPVPNLYQRISRPPFSGGKSTLCGAVPALPIRRRIMLSFTRKNRGRTGDENSGVCYHQTQQRTTSQ